MLVNDDESETVRAENSAKLRAHSAGSRKGSCRGNNNEKNNPSQYQASVSTSHSSDRYFFLMMFFKILPLGDLGMESTKNTPPSKALYLDNLARINAFTSSSVIVPFSGRTTKARGASYSS